MTWRNVAIVLAVICAYQTWRGCHRVAPKAAEPTEEQCRETLQITRVSQRASETRPAREDNAEPAPELAAAPGLSIGGFKIPEWARWLAPQPGENLLDYRDRIVPIAQAAVAPQRARVARGRDDFAKVANLDAQQRAQLDAAAAEAATAIQDKVIGSLMNGDLMPSTFKPMTGVALARDVLDTIDQANRRFIGSLREDQKDQLAQHPFDFADYLLFSTRWEDALGVTN